MFHYNIAAIARTYYEVRAQYRRSLGFDNPPRWDDIDYPARTRYISDVTHALLHISQGPASAHDEWSRSMRADGYIFGVPANSTDRRSTSLRPYHTLSKDRRMDDALLYGTVRALTRR